MDNIELKIWIELRKEVKEELLNIRCLFTKAKSREEMLDALYLKLVEMGENKSLNPHSRPIVEGWFKAEKVKSLSELNDADKEFQIQRIRMTYLVEKLKIIDEKIGQENVEKLEAYEIESILKLENRE